MHESDWNELIEFDWLHKCVMYAAMPIAKWWQETIIDRFYLLFTFLHFNGSTAEL